MIFIKLVRVLGAGLVAGLICHLLYSAGKKSIATKQRRQTSGTRRKFVRSSVIEKRDETSESDKENS